MGVDSNKKDALFIGAIFLGFLSVILSTLFTKNVNVLVVATQAILFFLIMYLFFYGLPNIIRKLIAWRPDFIYLPKLQHSFALPSPNDLRLYIHNPYRRKEVYLRCGATLLDVNGENYLFAHHNELHPTQNSRGGNPPLFVGTLKPKDRQEIIIGTSHNGRYIALRLNDVPLIGFLDGQYGYAVSCTGMYRNNNFMLPEFMVWLIVRDGALVEVKDTL